MRILHLTTFLQGGAGLAIATLASAQVRAGHEVAVITSRTSVPGYGNYPAHLQALAGAAVRTLEVDSLFDRSPAAHEAVGRAIDESFGGAGTFDLLHTHAAVPSAIARTAVARAGRRVPILQTMHGWGVAKTSDQAAHDVDVMNLVDRVVVPALASARHLHALGVDPRRVSVVPYGVGPAEDAAAPDDRVQEIREWRRRGRLVVCCVGTLGPRKNQRLLVDALSMVDAPARVHAVFAGDGPRRSLSALAAERGVANRVRFLGYRADARRVLGESDYLVLPSLSEGQPLAVLEAFCDGVPVLASRIPELEELIDDGRTGWLFDATDPRALASALSAACRLGGAARALAVRARAVYESRFTIERMVTGYMAEYARAA
jgi:glycosyltransferase involved in cell wall biosynthesis